MFCLILVAVYLAVLIAHRAYAHCLIVRLGHLRGRVVLYHYFGNVEYSRKLTVHLDCSFRVKQLPKFPQLVPGYSSAITPSRTACTPTTGFTAQSPVFMYSFTVPSRPTSPVLTIRFSRLTAATASGSSTSSVPLSVCARSRTGQST